MTKPIPGPHTDIVRLDWTPPAGAIDCHMHIFGPADRFPYAAQRDYTPPDATIAMYEAMCRATGIQRTVVVQPSVYGTDNRCTEDAVRHFGDQGRGVAVLDADVPDAELERLDDVGFRGCRFNLHNAGGTRLDDMERFAARLAELGWHLQVFTAAAHIAELEDRFARLPCNLVIDHFGLPVAGDGVDQPGFQALLRLPAAGRTWVKVSSAYRVDLTGMPFAGARPYAKTLIAAAPERVVWGTDWPHPMVTGPMPNDGDLMNLVARWTADDRLRRAILVDNPARLYGFG